MATLAERSKRWAGPLIGVLLLAALAGCGYHFVSARLPSDLDCVQLTRVTNETAEPGLDITLRRVIDDRLNALGLNCLSGQGRVGRLEVTVSSFTVSPEFLGTRDDGAWVAGAYRMDARVVARLSSSARRWDHVVVVVNRTFPITVTQGESRGVANALAAHAAWEEAGEEVADRILFHVLGGPDVTTR